MHASYTDEIIRKAQAPSSFTSPSSYVHDLPPNHFQDDSKIHTYKHYPDSSKTLKNRQKHGRPPLQTPRPSRHNRILSPRARTTSTHTGTPPPPPPLQRAHRHGARGRFHHGLHPLRVQHDEHPGGERECPSVQRERYRWGRAEFD